MALVIVESAAKGKKIQEILGGSYEVVACYGHVTDLPDKEIGIDLSDFTPTYVPTERGKSVIANLRRLVKKHEGSVYLATDLDREGEAIAWHLSTLLNLKRVQRITFSEITEDAVRNGIANHRSLDFNTIRGQESRRVLDRFVGYLPTLSISTKFGSGNSAGRVQSIGLRLVYDRDNEIAAFKPVEHYNVRAQFSADGVEFDAEWQHPFKIKAKPEENEPEGDSGYLTNKSLAEKMVAAIKQNLQFTVDSFEVTELV